MPEVSSSKFLADLSHELRTPLHAIMAYAQLLQAPPSARGTIVAKEEAVERILRNGRHLLSLLDTLLDLSALETGTCELRLETFDAAALVRATCEDLRSLAIEKKIAYLINVDDSLPLVTSDGLRLRQVLTNLLANAFKFTSRGCIEVTLQAENDREWYLRVTDTGIGIAEADLMRSFDRSFRVSNPSATAAGGAGLGLAIVQDLVRLLGGRITAQSQPDKGSSFLVTFPFALRLPSPPELQMVAQNKK